MVEQSEEILILKEATGARENTEKLLPLLDLLQEQEGETSSPIDELKSLLSAIIEILGHHTNALQRLEGLFAGVPPNDS